MKRHKSFFISVVLTILFVACVAGQPAAKFVYVADATSNQIQAYAADSVNGALTIVPGSPFSSGRSPAAIAVHPSNRFLYVANSGSSNLSAYAIDAETGALTDAPGSPFAAGDAPSAIAIHPNGRFLFAANTASNDVSVYTIDRSTGALTPVSGSPFSTAAAPSAVAADPRGRFVYIAAQGVIAAYRVDSRTGVLTHIDESPAGAVADLAVDNTGTFLYAGSANQMRGFRLDPASGQLTPLPDVTGLPEAARATLASRGQSIHAAGSVYHVDSQTGSLGLVRTSAAQSTLSATVLAGAALITDFAATGTHNNLTASLGMQFTVGAAPLNVTALGRIFVPGNTGTHTVKLIRASDKTEVPGGSAVVSLADGTAGQFVYAQLPTDAKALDALTSAAMDGKDVNTMPWLFRPYAEHAKDVLANSWTLATLRKKEPKSAKIVDAWMARSSLKEADVRYLRMSARQAWVAVLIDARTAEPRKLLITEKF